MGRSIVNTVVEGLAAAGIRAAAACPGSPAPYLTAPAATVSLALADPGQRVAKVLVTVLCPASEGAAVCETEGLKAADALTALGASCVQEECRYDGTTALFSVAVLATFTGAVGADEWAAGPDFSVQMGTGKLFYAVEFTAERFTEDPAATPISGCGWTFRVEEYFAPGQAEQNSPAEPFTMTVSRSGRVETFQNCRLTSVKREDTPGGMRQIRTGTAESMSHIAIL